MIRTVIIDDEAHVRDTLRRMLSKHSPQVFIAGEAAGVSDGLTVIRQQQPGLVILDINLGDGTAEDLIKALGRIEFDIILISASARSMTRDLATHDYPFLLKPINPLELNKAVTRSSEKFKPCGHA